MSEDREEKKLPVEKFCNKFAPYNHPKKKPGDGPLGNENTGHMYYRDKDKDKKKLVKIVQEMLVEREYLNLSCVNEKFDDDTEDALRKFQENNKDWDGKPLKIDGLVGPETADALNRRMVGRWYEHYITPKELVKNMPYHTVTSEFLANGLSIETNNSKNGRIILVNLVFYRYSLYAGEGGWPSEARLQITSQDGIQKYTFTVGEGKLINNYRSFDLYGIRRGVRYDCDLFLGEMHIRLFESAEISRILDPDDPYKVLPPPATANEQASLNSELGSTPDRV